MDAIETYFIHIPNAFRRFEQVLTDKIALVGFLAVLDSFSSIKKSIMCAYVTFVYLFNFWHLDLNCFARIV